MPRCQLDSVTDVAVSQLDSRLQGVSIFKSIPQGRRSIVLVESRLVDCPQPLSVVLCPLSSPRADERRPDPPRDGEVRTKDKGQPTKAEDFGHLDLGRGQFDFGLWTTFDTLLLTC